MRLLLDARAAGRPQQTGWERYAQRLAEAFDKSPRVEVAEGWRPAYRFAAPWELLPHRLPPDIGAIHYPAFPPTHVPRGARLVMTLHDLTWWRFPEMATRMGRSFYKPLTQRALGCADLVIADSHAVRDEILERWPSLGNRCEVVYPGPGLADPSLADLDSRPSRQRPYFLCIATIEPRKDLATLARAFSRSGLAADVDLVVVGRIGWGDPPPGVNVVEGLPDEALHALYANALALVSPSIYEGFGLPVLEAMLHETPVICTDIPVFREVSAGHAEFFPTGDAEALAELLQAAVHQPREHTAAALAHAATLNWKRAADEMLGLYESVLARSR